MTLKELENELDEAINIIFRKRNESEDIKIEAICHALDNFKTSIIKYLEENK